MLRAVPDHPKFAELKALLKLPKGAAAGFLEMMWHFAGRFTPQGNIGKYSDAAIEAWVEWNGEPGALIAALEKAHWLDRHPVHGLVVHDFHDHADDATRLSLKRKRLDFLTRCPDTVPTTSGLPEPGAGAEPGAEPEPGARVISIRPVVDETWTLFEAEADKAGMVASDEERIDLSRKWASLDFEHRLKAIDALKRRMANGEYSSGFVPTMRNYLWDRLWTRADRPRPKARDAPAEKKASNFRQDFGAEIAGPCKDCGSVAACGCAAAKVSQALEGLRSGMQVRQIGASK